MNISGGIANKNSDTLFSYWLVTRKCNYTCPYCVCPGLQDNPPNATNDTLSKTIDAYNYLETIKPVKLLISGGEPTLLDLPNILSRLELSLPIGVFTNFSQSVEYYINLNTIHPIQINSTLHETQIDTNEFIKKANELIEHCPIIVKIMIKSLRSIKMALDVKQKMDKRIQLEFLTVNNQYENSMLRKEVNKLNDTKIYFYNDKELSLHELKYMSSFFNWTCSAGNNSLCIDYNGGVYLCKAHFQTREPIFSVYDDFQAKYKKLPKSTICTMNYCEAEYEIIKYKE